MVSEVTKKAIPTLFGSLKGIPRIDSSLTMEGCCADAKAVGDRLREATKAINFSYDGKGNGLNAKTLQEAFDEIMDIKAPSGYVEDVFEVATLDEFNAKIDELEGAMDVKTIKRYAITKSNWDNQFPSADYFVEIRKAWHGYSSVTATAVCEGSLTVLQRVLSDNAWKAWEWENPRAMLWEEYRTTERWMGKPVYTKIISAKYDHDIGNAGGSYSFAIEFSTPNFHRLVRYNGCIDGANQYGQSNTQVLPFHNQNEGSMGASYMNMGGLALAIEKFVVPANTEFFIQLWYTKITD